MNTKCMVKILILFFMLLKICGEKKKKRKISIALKQTNKQKQPTIPEIISFILFQFDLSL